MPTLGNIENVVNDEEKRVRKGRDDDKVVTLGPGEFGLEGQTRHADNTVHRCSGGNQENR